MNDNVPSEFDKRLGRRLRDARIMRKLSQQNVADILGVKYQQIQKYEKGQNRISPERLLTFSESLDVPLTFLLTEREAEMKPEKLLSAESLKLAVNIEELPDNVIRLNVKRLVTSIHEAWHRKVL